MKRLGLRMLRTRFRESQKYFQLLDRFLNQILIFDLYIDNVNPVTEMSFGSLEYALTFVGAVSPGFVAVE